MNKKAIVALAAVLAFGFASKTAFAAPSPTAADTVIYAEAVTVDETQGTTEVLDVATVTAANNEARKVVAEIIAQAYSANQSEDGFVDENGNLILTEDGTPLGESAEPEILAAVEFKPSEAVLEEIKKNGSAEVKFTVGDVKEGDSVKVLHFLESKGEWEVIEPTSVKDGEVTAKFTSFSPIVITRIPASVAAVVSGTEKAATSNSNYFILIAIILVAAAAIAGVCVFGNKKTSKNK